MFYTFKQYLSLSKIMIKNEFWENFWGATEDIQSLPTEKSEEINDKPEKSYEELLSDLNQKYEDEREVIAQESKDAYKEQFGNEMIVDNIPKSIKRPEYKEVVPTEWPWITHTLKNIVRPEEPTEWPTEVPTVEPIPDPEFKHPPLNDNE